jgi:hypothetical protein
MRSPIRGCPVKRSWLLAVIPPATVALVALLLLPLGYISAGGWIAVAVLLLAYITQVTLPALAPTSEKSFVFSGSYALVIYPYLVAAAIIALVAVAVPGISWKWVLAADLVVAGLAATAAIGVSAVSDKDARSHAATMSQVNDLRLLALSVEQFGQTIPDPAEATFARKVAEQLRLSPFVGVPASVDLEVDVASAVGALRQIPPHADLALVHSALDRISSLVRHRNELVKFSR